MVEAPREHRKRQQEERLRLDDLWDTRYDLVFCNGIGRPIEATDFLKCEFYRWLEREGLPRITFHGLRRTIATLLKGENAHPRDVAALLGHAVTKLTLDTCTQMLPGVQAALLQKIEKLFWSEHETN